MALNDSTIREHKFHYSELVATPVKGGERIHAGALVAVDANGLLVAASDTAGLKIWGVAEEPLDNTNGSDGSVDGDSGERFIRVDTVGEWAFAVSGAEPDAGDAAFVVDDDTVSADATTNNIKAGVFTRPAPGGGWFVDVERSGA